MGIYIFGFLSVWVGVLIEGVITKLFGPAYSPNLLIILIVLFNLFRGIRYSLFVAVLGGLFKDSLAPYGFGLNTFSFVFCAYLTTLIKHYIYQPGSDALRVFLVMLISMFNIFMHFLLSLMFIPIGLSEALVRILIPEVLLTAVVTPYVFLKFKECVLKLSNF